MKKIIAYLYYFILAAIITVMIVGICLAIAYLIVENWMFMFPVVLIFAFYGVKTHFEEKNKSTGK